MTAFPMSIFTENRFRKVGRQINVCSEKCSLRPVFHYEKLKEDLFFLLCCRTRKVDLETAYQF